MSNEYVGPMVYVVFGETGEYSDRSEWPVAAYSTGEMAEARADSLAAKYRELTENGTIITDYDQREAIETAMRIYDPEFRLDYTGTHWYVLSVPLVA